MKLQISAFNRLSSDGLVQLLIIIATNSTRPSFTLLRLCKSFAKENASFAGWKRQSLDPSTRRIHLLVQPNLVFRLSEPVVLYLNTGHPALKAESSVSLNVIVAVSQGRDFLAFQTVASLAVWAASLFNFGSLRRLCWCLMRGFSTLLLLLWLKKEL